MPDEMNLNLLRAYLDGELPTEEASRVEAMLANDAKWKRLLAAEQELSRRIEQMMGHAAAPQELRERIVAELREAQLAEPAFVPASRPPAVQPAAQTDDRDVTVSSPGLLAALSAIFGRQHRVSFAAVAATLILVTAVVLVGIFGTGIDGQSEQLWQASGLLSAVAQHVSQEHDRCAANDGVLASKLIAMTREEAAASLQKHLEVDSVTVFDFGDAGYRFVGFGPCSLPGPARSAHLIYQRDVPGEPQSMMSIFVTQNLGQFPEMCAKKGRRDGRWTGVCGGKSCSKTILHGEDEQLVYFIACGFADQVQLISQEICKALARRER
jgi:hypothetical protein